ncbi:MAG: FecR domain-containing protein [Nitrospirales bacterium]|nr:FecR family protein [Nitrospirales bacterium]
MSEKDQDSSAPFPNEQALQWFVHLQSGEATVGDRRCFEAWVLESPVHQKEFEYFSKIWKTLDQAKPFVADDIKQAEAFWDTARLTRFSAIRQGFFQWGRIPVVVLTLMVLVVLVPWFGSRQRAVENQYQTVKGEQQTIVLTDGSKIIMNTDTKISVRLSDADRVVTLRQGEALFTVTHDERRPFEVRAGNGTVRDLGTQFTVYTSPEQVNVFVLDGVVEVGLNEPTHSFPMSSPQIVRQGQKVSYTADGQVSAVESFDRQTENSWIEGRLIFQGQPLEQVLKDVGRYQSGEIRLLDSTLAAVPVSGIFNIHDLGSFLQALQDTLPVRATRINPRLVIVERILNPDSSTSSRAGQPSS